MEAAQSTHSLSRRDNSIVVCDLLVIDISCLRQILITALCQDLLCKRLSVHIPTQTANVFLYLFCHRGGEHTGICSGVSDQFFLIQLLDNFQSLIRADLK